MIAGLVIGYLIGSVPFGLLLTWAAGLGDIRRIGSGNIGATNVLRTGKRGLAAATLILDAGKGVVAVLVAARLFGSGAALAGGFGAMIGHVAPVWLGFRGGKGVATGLGVLLAAFWPVGVLACAIWAGVAAIFRFSSLSALCAFAAAPVLSALFSEWRLAALSLLLALVVFVRHGQNIRRLLGGTEPKIGASH
ncbi:MAG: glycerol-3-phosphate 1-O-acyltransferase PlsY [Acetobacteraceae bacterium]